MKSISHFLSSLKHRIKYNEELKNGRCAFINQIRYFRKIKIIHLGMKTKKQPPSISRTIEFDADQAVDPSLHLFNDVPIASFEIDPQIIPKKKKRTQNSNSFSASPQSITPLTSDSLKRTSLIDSQHQSLLLHKKAHLKKKQPRQQFLPNDSPLHKHRIRNICRNVVSKMKLNNAYGNVVNEEELERFKEKNARAGWDVSERVRYFWDTFASLVMIFLFLSQTFLLVFLQLSNSSANRVLAMLGSVVFGGQVMLNLLTVRKYQGYKLKALNQIAWDYATGELCVDASLFIVLILQTLTSMVQFNQLFVGLSVLKAPSLVGKLYRIQRWIFKTEYYERYWSLLKIMLFNLAFAHVIAIMLNLMAKVNHQQNWQIVRGINSAWWGQRYIWSYYWATTIMLTVGFGDIVPSTYHQAIWVIIIQIVSCIAFSYNISCLGNLISSIRSQGEIISKNRKVFQNFAQKRSLPQPLTQKVLHYIDQSEHVKTRFNIIQERQLINQLPESYRTRVLAQSNKTLLKSLPFFNQILLKAICQLSKRFQRNVYFPQQTIKYARSDHHIYILEKGEVGFACRTPGSSLNKVYADTIKRTEKEGPFLLSTDFITLSTSKYDIRSKDYSIVHWLSFQEFKSILGGFRKDYEYYCFLKDRAKFVLNEYQTIFCQNCKQKHTKFACPKLHYIPIHEHVMHKELHARQLAKNQRKIVFERIRKVKVNALLLDNICQKQKIMLTQLHGDTFQHIPKMMTMLDCHKQGILTQMKSQAIKQGKVKRRQQHIDLLNSLMMMELRQELREKDEMQLDEVWLLNCDKIEEYTIFFPQNNLKAVISKHKQLKKIQNKLKQSLSM